MQRILTTRMRLTTLPSLFRSPSSSPKAASPRKNRLRMALKCGTLSPQRSKQSQSTAKATPAQQLKVRANPQQPPQSCPTFTPRLAARSANSYSRIRLRAAQLASKATNSRRELRGLLLTSTALVQNKRLGLTHRDRITRRWISRSVFASCSIMTPNTQSSKSSRSPSV